jgi:hypothetical protein
MHVQLDNENPGTGNIRGLNLAAVKPTTVQVSNCRFLGLNTVEAWAAALSCIDRCPCM